MIKKTVTSIKVDINTYHIDTENTERADVIAETIAEYVLAKLAELDPKGKPSVEITKNIEYKEDGEVNPFER